jgi:hypothetical protein
MRAPFECRKTLTGSAFGSVIEEYWNLVHDCGRICRNEAYEIVFRVKLPDSGRSQTLRGPQLISS